MTLAANADFTMAQIEIGRIYLRGAYGVPKDEPKALGFLQAASDKNDKYAQFYLAQMYYFGLGGLTQSYDSAIDLFEKAANQKLPNAEYMMGKMVEHGLGAQQSVDDAKQWYQGAIEDGDNGPARAALQRLSP